VSSSSSESDELTNADALTGSSYDYDSGASLVPSGFLVPSFLSLS
jgi:hypothetical protein